MSELNATTEHWCQCVAAFAADALLDAKLVPRDSFEVAKAIIAEEIFVRLCCNDYPPPMAYTTLPGSKSAESDSPTSINK